ncbi:MAG TPA: hypothetical protein VGB22_10895 [candidate division Zixibacteria bacterium]|jgi:hypothetical protein
MASITSAVIRQAIAALAAVALWTGCTTERALTPHIAGYNLYVSAGPEGTIYVIDVASRALIDSIPGLGLVSHMTASADGRWLFVELTLEGDRITRTCRIDLRTKQEAGIREDPYEHYLIALDDENLLVRSVCDIELIDMDDFRTVFVDTVLAFCCYAQPPRGRRLLGYVRAMLPQAVVYDVRERRVVKTFTPVAPGGDTITIYQGVVHPTREWAVFLGVDERYHAWFVVYDIGADSMLYRHARVYAAGEVAVTRDGTRAVATDPGSPVNDPVRIVDVYDLQGLTHLARYGRDDGLTANSQIDLVEERDVAIVAPIQGWTTGPICVITLDTPSIELINPVYLTGIGGTAVGPRVD